MSKTLDPIVELREILDEAARRAAVDLVSVMIDADVLDVWIRCEGGCMHLVADGWQVLSVEDLRQMVRQSFTDWTRGGDWYECEELEL